MSQTFDNQSELFELEPNISRLSVFSINATPSANPENVVQVPIQSYN